MILKLLAFPFLAFALYIVLEQLKIFHSSTEIINIILATGISAISYLLLFPLSPVIGAVSLFFIFIEKYKGDKGLTLGLTLGVSYFLLTLIF